MDVPSPLTLLELLDSWRRREPERGETPAIVEIDVQASRRAGPPVVRRTVTPNQLWADTIACAAWLRASGVGRGDVVGIQLPTWHEFVVAQLAANAIGAVAMPISPIYRARDVARQLALGRARVLLVPAGYGSFDYSAMADGLRREIASLQTVIVVGDGAPAGALTWRELIAAGNAAALAGDRATIAAHRYALGPREFSLLNFTSGTTGEPKGVMHSTATVCAAVGGGIRRMELGRDDVLFVAVTLGHAAGFLNGLYMPMLLGAKVVYMDLWDPGIALAVIESQKVSYGPAMPTYLFDLANHPNFANADISSWRAARVSGGSISRPLMAALQARLPHLRLCPGWGMSEACYVTCGSPHDSIEKRSRTEGRPLDGFELQIRDRTCTRELPAGEAGEMVIRTPSLMLGYYGQEALTRAAFTADGWLRTGDLGYLDAEGFLTMVGRSKEIIVRGGENVPVVEVEQLLMEHPKVTAAVVVGVPDARLGEKVCAAIEVKDRADPLAFPEMQRYLVERQLTRQFIPEYLVVFDDPMPRTGIGKIRKPDVRGKVLERLAIG